MALKRMFSNQVIDTDSFLDLPVPAQCLYFHLGMKADDDGFIPNATRIVRTVGCSTKDLQTLVNAGYLIEFPERRLFVVTDFRINNAIRADRYRPTVHQDEFRRLILNQNSRYTIGIPNDNQMTTNTEPDAKASEPQEPNDINVSGVGIPNGNQMTTKCQPSIDKYSIDKDSIEEDSIDNTGAVGSMNAGKFIPPTIEQIRAYCRERNNAVDPEQFFDYYSSNGWKVGRNPMKDWKAGVRTWERNQKGGSRNGLFGTRQENRIPGQRELYGDGY